MATDRRWKVTVLLIPSTRYPSSRLPLLRKSIKQLQLNVEHQHTRHQPRTNATDSQPHLIMDLSNLPALPPSPLPSKASVSPDIVDALTSTITATLASHLPPLTSLVAQLQSQLLHRSPHDLRTPGDNQVWSMQEVNQLIKYFNEKEEHVWRRVAILESQIRDLTVENTGPPSSSGAVDDNQSSGNRAGDRSGTSDEDERGERGRTQDDETLEEEMARLTQDEAPTDLDHYGGVLIAERRAEGAGGDEGMSSGQRIVRPLVLSSFVTHESILKNSNSMDVNGTQRSSTSQITSDLHQRDFELAKSRSDYEQACDHSSKLEQLLFGAETQIGQVSLELKRGRQRFDELQGEFERMRAAATTELQIAAQRVYTMEMEDARRSDRMREVEGTLRRRETEQWARATGQRPGRDNTPRASPPIRPTPISMPPSHRTAPLAGAGGRVVFPPPDDDSSYGWFA
jgi:hypothetical protein